MSKWEIVFMKDSGEVVLDFFNSKKEAEQEVEYRYYLCKHLGYTPDQVYKVRRAKNRREV